MNSPFFGAVFTKSECEDIIKIVKIPTECKKGECGLDSGKLETFLYVCKEKSFAKAAEKLFITPAAIKKQIDSLEEEVGAPLLLRTSSGCVPTPAGEVFREWARKILDLIHESVEAARLAEKEQISKIRIGHSVRFDYGFVSRLTDGYDEAYPGEFLRFDRIKKTELVSALKDRLIDCFVYLNPHKGDFPGIPSLLLGTTQIHAIVRRSHPLANRQTVTFQDILPYDIFISAVLDRELYEALDAQAGSSLHILDKEDRNTLLFRLQRNAVILYPCPVDHDCSIPFAYRPLEIRLYFFDQTRMTDHFARHIQRLLDSKKDLVII